MGILMEKKHLINSSEKAASKECLGSREGTSEPKTRKTAPSPNNKSEESFSDEGPGWESHRTKSV
jgi:hypothetical protein